MYYIGIPENYSSVKLALVALLRLPYCDRLDYFKGISLYKERVYHHKLSDDSPNSNYLSEAESSGRGLCSLETSVANVARALVSSLAPQSEDSPPTHAKPENHCTLQDRSKHSDSGALIYLSKTGNDLIGDIQITHTRKLTCNPLQGQVAKLVWRRCKLLYFEGCNCAWSVPLTHP